MALSATKGPSKIVSVIQGEYAVSSDPHVAMSTVLGSCIAACIFDPVKRVGGMNHFLLPEARSGDGQNVKYGAFLMELLINDLLKHGAERHRMKVKLVGGAQMSKFLGDIGQKNIAFARRYLESEGMPVEWESLGGLQARRIHFFPTTGVLQEKFVMNDSDVDKPVRPRRRRPDAGVELF